MTSQPDWELIDNLGDADPLEYGGYFVFRDKTGVYRPEAEYLYALSPEEGDYDEDYDYREETADDLDDDPEQSGCRWTIYRFSLELFTYGLKSESGEPWEPLLRPLDEWQEAGVLSDNPYRPDYPVWFSVESRYDRKLDAHVSHSKLPDLASHCGMSATELLRLFLSVDPLQRARGYEIVASYYGWDDFDNYPLQFGPDAGPELRHRYNLD